MSLAPRARVTSAIKEALLCAGHYARRLAGDRFPGVAVLCYHGVRADDDPDGAHAFAGLHVRARELEAHCRMLAALCHPIALDDWRRARAGGPPLPARPVLVTFDDGYRSVHARALPVLARHGVPAVLFACSAPVERRALLWYDALARREGEAAVERAKSLPWAAWERLAAAAPTVGDDDPQAALRPEELGALAASGLFEIGGHSAAHPILARGDAEAQRRQIGDNLARLAAWSGRPVRAFAYPNGRPAIDYDATTVRLVAEAGCDFGFTTREGFATDGEPPLERSRFTMLAGLSAAELAHRLAYSYRRDHARTSQPPGIG